MSFHHKYSYEQKVQIITKYCEGTQGFRELCSTYGMAQQTLKDWIRLYRTFGYEGLKSDSRGTKYSSEIKQKAVEDYLAHELTISEILMKYKIRSDTQLRNWVLKYQGIHKAGGNVSSKKIRKETKGRKTSLEERAGIVKYCIEHEHDYIETAKKYKISYQQARNYTIKYETNGLEGLQDHRGKKKSLEEMSELERLRMENKILRVEKERVEMEVAFLKKIEATERRWV